MRVTNEINPQLDDGVMVIVEQWKAVLRRRCLYTGLDVEDDQVIHCVLDEFIYVIANPVLREEAVYDEAGIPTGEYVPLRNLTLCYQPQIEVNWYDAPQELWERMRGIPIEFRPDRVTVDNPNPWSIEPIPRPDLLIKLNMDGNMVVDGCDLPPIPRKFFGVIGQVTK